MSERVFSFEVNRTSAAPPAVLFRLESEGPEWARWARPLVWQASWVRHGDPAPAGVGAVRGVGAWPLLMRERTVEYEPDHRHVYTFAGAPVPVRNYRAEVLFTSNATGGTDLRWSGSFTEIVPRTGPLLRVVLRGVIETLATRLARAAERA